MKKTLSLMLVLALMLALLAGCGGTSTDTGSNAADGAAPADTADAPADAAPADGGDAPSDTANAGGAAFKLGGTGPLTGGAAIYGNAAKNGAQIAVDEINAMGGIQFELRYEDDTHDAEKAVNAYNTLKDWGMQLSLGSVTSAPCNATATETYADRIFALTPSASAPTVIEGKDNMFQMCFLDYPTQGGASAQYISDMGLGEKIAVIWKNDEDYSTGLRNSFMDKADELGLNVVSETTFTSETKDFTVQLTEAQNAGADLVFLPMYYEPASLIFAQASAMGFAPKWFGVDGMDGILTMDGFDPSMAEGVMLLTPFNADSSDAATVAFVGKYQELYGETPNQFAADAYDCVYAYKQALEAAGATADMSASELCDLMISQFTSMTFNGLTGTGMTWDATGAVSKGAHGCVIKDGAYVGLD